MFGWDKPRFTTYSDNICYLSICLLTVLCRKPEYGRIGIYFSDVFYCHCYFHACLLFPGKTVTYKPRQEYSTAFMCLLRDEEREGEGGRETERDGEGGRGRERGRERERKRDEGWRDIMGRENTGGRKGGRQGGYIEMGGREMDRVRGRGREGEGVGMERQREGVGGRERGDGKERDRESWRAEAVRPTNFEPYCTRL